MNIPDIRGAGLGLRREMIPDLQAQVPSVIDFFEVAPENWMDLGGKASREFRSFSERYPIVCHGLSLSLGGPSPLDELFLRRLKIFLDDHHIRLYTEHLSYCSDNGHLYDLLPIPFTGDAVRYTAARIRQTQDILERPIAIENASFYTGSAADEMTEWEFINAVLSEADCFLHLDINNVYVNSVNHGYNPVRFLSRMPSERVIYMHVAGHYQESADLIIDTHGAPVIDPVWELLQEAYQRFGVHPTLLERDFNIPPLAELVEEMDTIVALQRAAATSSGMRNA